LRNLDQAGKCEVFLKQDLASMHTGMMTEIIKRLKNEHQLDAVMVSLSDEHSLSQVGPTLKDAALAAGVPLYCGIGGCEAYRDIYDARSIGADAIIAPMIDSAYSLDKFADAVSAVFRDSDRKSIKVFAALQSIDAVIATSEILSSNGRTGIDGIIIDCDECASSAGEWGEWCLRGVRGSLESAKSAGVTVTLHFSRLYAGIDQLIDHSSVTSLASGRMFVNSRGVCTTGPGCFLEKARELNIEIDTMLKSRGSL
jgi:methylmalonyl-CoA mutase cobalamin-binding subunit